MFCIRLPSYWYTIENKLGMICFFIFGLPGLLPWCILGRKYTCGVLGFAFIRFFPSCSLISFSFMKDSMALLMISPCLLVGLCVSSA